MVSHCRVACRDSAQSNGPVPKKVVVVGAGWAGLGATKHLAEQGAVLMICRGSVCSASAAFADHGPPFLLRGYGAVCISPRWDLWEGGAAGLQGNEHRTWSLQPALISVPESAGYDVELLDAAENPGGLSAGWRTKDGKPVEAGMKGFWYHVGIPLPAEPLCPALYFIGPLCIKCV